MPGYPTSARRINLGRQEFRPSPFRFESWWKDLWDPNQPTPEGPSYEDIQTLHNMVAPRGQSGADYYLWLLAMAQRNKVRPLQGAYQEGPFSNRMPPQFQFKMPGPGFFDY